MTHHRTTRPRRLGIAVALVAVLTLGLAACGSSSKKENTRAVAATVRTANETIPCSRTVSAASLAAQAQAAAPVA